MGELGSNFERAVREAMATSATETQGARPTTELAPPQPDPGTLTQNERLVRRLIEEGFNQGHLDVLAEVLHPAYVEHQPVMEGIPPTAEAVRATILSLRTGFPDLHLDIREVDAVGDRVWLQVRATGTQNGPFMGNPPSGRSMSIDVLDIVKIQDGRIGEHWGVPDHLAMMEQLGWLP